MGNQVREQALLGQDVLRRFVPFASLSDTHVRDLLRKGRLLHVGRGRILFKRGQREGNLHFLISGNVDLADARFEVTAVRADSERAQLPLDDAYTHRVTAVTTSPVTVFVIPKDVVDLALTWDQAGNYLVTDLVEGDRGDAEQDWMSGLLASALFTAIPPANIQRLFSCFEAVHVRAGDLILEQGEVGDHFYAIKRGRARIIRTLQRAGRSIEMPVAELSAGDVFGEDALIGQAPRNASVRMVTDGVLMRLEQSLFAELLEDRVVVHVDGEELERLRSHGDVEVIDVRTPGEFRRSAVPQSRNLPLDLLRQNLSRLEEGRIYVVVCDGGRRSRLACYLLIQAGFDARVLDAPVHKPV
ncbi:MAG: cyclic nucleotide-binding domain-containing protein [Pseudomonadales bacterium]|jgi:CRP-like cAMP-binding protein|nr:cyclic nucleotide-binding domain-containing protein [Pseudomonadales bacterium]